MSKLTRLDRLRAIERALVKSEDQTAAIDAALEETREEIALERMAQQTLRVTAWNRRRLTALVTASTKLDTASRLAKESAVGIASSGLFPVEVREYVQKTAAALDAHVARIAAVIQEIP